MQVAKVHYNDKNAPADFTRSLKETGFGILVGHPIPAKLIDSIIMKRLKIRNHLLKNF